MATAALNTKAMETENKIPDINDMATNATLNNKPTEVEITSLILPAQLSDIKPTEFECKIPSGSGFTLQVLLILKNLID